MANPQKKNGYTGVANEILEQITKVSLNGTQFRIVLAVWRLTYGFQRKEHEMSVTFLAKVINASRSQVDRELQVLIDKKILVVTENGLRKIRVISFNKNYEEWEELNSARKGTPPPPKKKKQPTKKKVYDEENIYYKMAKYFYDRVALAAEVEGLSHLIIKANLQSWADDMRKLIEIDKVADITEKEGKKLVTDIINWTTEHDFWKANILSAKRLREKFGTLAMQMKKDQKPGGNSKQPNKADPRNKEIEFQQWVNEGKDPDEFDWSKS